MMHSTGPKKREETASSHSRKKREVLTRDVGDDLFGPGPKSLCELGITTVAIRTFGVAIRPVFARNRTSMRMYGDVRLGGGTLGHRLQNQGIADRVASLQQWT